MWENLLVYAVARLYCTCCRGGADIGRYTEIDSGGARTTRFDSGDRAEGPITYLHKFIFFPFALVPACKGPLPWLVL